MIKHLFFLLFLFWFQPLFAQQQDTTNIQNSRSIELYLDCRGCDEQYIRTEITFVNFVRDQSDADVHLLVTRQFTGSGGREFTLRFVGRNEFKGREETLIYTSYESDSRDERRRGLVRSIKAGLIPYLTQTNVIQGLEITYNQQPEQQNDANYDKWNNWIFEIGLNSFFYGEESRKNIDFQGRASARRITRNWKTQFFFRQNYNRRKFSYDDTTEVFVTQSSRYEGLVAKSINEHWSLGLFTEVSSSSRDNYDLRIGGAPAIEYNIFPYSEYAQREISFGFGILATYNKYNEITIFNTTEDFLVQNRLWANLEFTQLWGEIEGSIEAHNYLHDWSKNRLNFDLEFDIQIARGLSINLFGRYSVINDQLSIPLGDITEEEQLLNLREQATSYSFRGFIGFEYTFGSIYSSEVNPRF